MKKLTFIDLFAGIGGFRLGLEKSGMKCVFTSEWDKECQKIYFANFKGKIAGDITKIKEETIPSHDILCGGFPCQAFSVSGKQEGFDDTRGTLIYDVFRIIKHHNPKCIFLENVKNLEKHDKGRTFKTIKKELKKLGYKVFYEILNSSNYGIPQARNRIYIVAFRKDLGINNFNFPKSCNKIFSLKDFLLDESDSRISDLYIKRTDITFLTKDIVANNKPIQIGYFAKGRQGERIYSTEGHAITLSAYGGGIAAKTGAYLISKNKIRKLHPIECARLQGFPDDFIISESNSQAWKQFGNSVSVPVIYKIAKNIKELI